jgi:hypothetical protein
MKLSQLIELTLNEIAVGVRSAKEKSWETMVIAPGTINDRDVTEITYVEFDLSVAIDEANAKSSAREKGIGGELRVLSVGGSGKINSNRGASKSSASKTSQRIAFKVPVCMGAKYCPREKTTEETR